MLLVCISWAVAFHRLEARATRGIRVRNACQVIHSEQMAPVTAAHRIALFIKNLDGGGVQKVTLSLAEALSQHGCQIDLVISQAAGDFVNRVPASVNLVTLRAAPSWAARKAVLAAAGKDLAALLHVSLPMKSTHTLRYLPDLVRYLRQERPLALLAAEPRLNCEAVWARHLAQVPTRLAVSEHLHLSRSKFGSAQWRKPYLPHLLRRTYMAADAIIAVSDGVADDLAASTGIPRKRITTIYNPVVTPQLQAKAQEPMDHPWFVPGAPPVLLSVGRLSEQKDFSTLLRAFARLRVLHAGQNGQAGRDVRLLVLGEGLQRRQLEALIRRLGLNAVVGLPGFVPNPFAYMARAAGFVLSSTYEGLPTVLIEALACACPVVSTDCPSGPAEILRNGQDGVLVPVGHEAALAEALHRLLAAPPARKHLPSRAARFSTQNAVQRYLKVLFNTTQNNSAQANTWGHQGGMP